MLLLLCRSPYGLWTFSINTEWLNPAVPIEAVSIQLHIQYDTIGPVPGPSGYIIFEDYDSITTLQAPC
jgi:hypothetical protein